MKRMFTATAIVLYLFVFQFSTLYAAEIPVSEEQIPVADTILPETVEATTDDISAEPSDPAAETAISETTDDTTDTRMPEPQDEPEADDLTQQSVSPTAPEIKAASAVMIDAETGFILYDKEMDTQNYPASITKIMTALLTIELCEDLSQPIVFSHNAIYSLPGDASHIAMNEGETLTIYDALNGLLLASANEVANAMAEHVGGTVDDFVELMNNRAAALGAVNTHFENPNGLFTENHYTTAHDMALIMREAVSYPVFNEIIAKRRYDIPPTEQQEQVRELLNTNKLIQPGPYYNKWVVGGKTGYTDEARHTLVTYAVRDGRSLIVAVMYDENAASFTDTNALLAYGFDYPFEEQVVFDSSAFAHALPVYQTINGIKTNIGEVTLTGARDLTYLLPAGYDTTAIRYELSIPNELAPPIMTGDDVGYVTCYVQDLQVGIVKLRAANAVGTMTVKPEIQPITVPETEQEIENETHEPVTAQAPVRMTAGEYISTLVVPLALSFSTLLLSVIMFMIRRKRRRAKIIRFDRYTRYGGPMYRYKP